VRHGFHARTEHRSPNCKPLIVGASRGEPLGTIEIELPDKEADAAVVDVSVVTNRLQIFSIVAPKT
jgi:hypothetical protein